MLNHIHNNHLHNADNGGQRVEMCTDE